jgi:hypothetical protein
MTDFPQIPARAQCTSSGSSTSNHIVTNETIAAVAAISASVAPWFPPSIPQTRRSPHNRERSSAPRPILSRSSRAAASGLARRRSPDLTRDSNRRKRELWRTDPRQSHVLDPHPKKTLPAPESAPTSASIAPQATQDFSSMDKFAGTQGKSDRPDLHCCPDPCPTLTVILGK